jgi:hypothetical protein
MGIQVPTFTDAMSQAKPDELPSASVSTSAPPDAFGASASKIGEAGQGAMKDITDYAKEQKDQANQIAHIQADTAQSQLQTDIQTNVAKMKGQDAFNAPEYMEQRWREGTDKIAEGLNGKEQQLAFMRTSSQRYDDLNKSVQVHVAGEVQNFDDQTTQSGIDQARNAMVVNAGDDHQIQQNLDIQKQLLEGWAKRKGVPLDSSVYKDKFTTETSASSLAVIHARLEAGMDDAAQKYFDANKDTMSGQDIIHAENVLDASKVVGESNDIFTAIMDGSAGKGFKFSDGTVNAEKVRQYVMDQAKEDGISDQRSLKVMGQVKAQIAEYNRDRYHQISANERDFANEVIQGRQNNVSLQDAQKLATKWGHDAYDIAQKQEFINKTYAPPAETKTIAFEQLKEGNENGTTELADWDRALSKGEINPSDWASGRQQKMKIAADGTDPVSKQTNSYINSMAAAKFGSDKQAIADFKYVVEQKSQGKGPDEKLAIAKQEMENVPKEHWWQIFGTDHQYQRDATAIEGRNTARGAIYQDVGFKQVQAVASGMTGGGFQRTQAPEANLQAFANTLGLKSLDEMKIGTPVNNAIESIRARGKLVTPELVQKVLKKYPDGKAQ